MADDRTPVICPLMRGHFTRQRSLFRWSPSRRAAAHTGTHGYLYLRARDGSLGGSVQLPLSVLRSKIDTLGDESELGNHRREIEMLARSSISIREDGAGLELTATGLTTLPVESGAYAVLDYTVGPVGTLPRTFEVRLGGALLADPHFELVVVTPRDVGFGSFQRRPSTQHALDHHQPTATVTISQTSLAENLAQTLITAGRVGLKAVWRRVRR